MGTLTSCHVSVTRCEIVRLLAPFSFRPCSGNPVVPVVRAFRGVAWSEGVMGENAVWSSWILTSLDVINMMVALALWRGMGGVWRALSFLMSLPLILSSFFWFCHSQTTSPPRRSNPSAISALVCLSDSLSLSPTGQIGSKGGNLLPVMERDRSDWMSVFPGL